MWNKGEQNILKFGALEGASIGQHTVWTRGGVYPWPTVASVVSVASTSGALDAGLHVTVNGLEATTYEAITEEVILDASGTATSTKPFIRLHRMWNSNSLQSIGTIEGSISGTVVCDFIPEANQSQVAIFTIPAGHFGYILRANYASGNKDEVSFGLRTREIGKVFRLKDNVFGLTASTVDRDFAEPDRPQSGLYVPEKTDIEVTCNVLTVNARLSSTFALVLFKARP